MSSAMLTYRDLHRTVAATSADRRALYCQVCGYGVSVRREPPECPMCHSRSWSDQRFSPRWN